MIGSNWERNVSSLFVGEEHCVTRQKRLRDSEEDYQVYKYFTNLWNIRSYKIRCYIYEILQLYNKSQIYEFINITPSLGTPEHFLTYQQSIFGRFSCKELKKRKKMIPYLFKFVEWFQRYEILKVRIFHFFVLKILNLPPKKWDQYWPSFPSLQLRVHSNYHYSSSL